MAVFREHDGMSIGNSRHRGETIEIPIWVVPTHEWERPARRNEDRARGRAWATLAAFLRWPAFCCRGPQCNPESLEARAGITEVTSVFLTRLWRGRKQEGAFTARDV